MISYRIVERVDTHVYKLNTFSRIYLIFHVSLLKPRENNSLSSQYAHYIKNLAIKINDYNKYKIKSILEYRRREREFQYNVKWLD